MATTNFVEMRDELVDQMSKEFPGFAIKFKEEGYKGLAPHYRFATWFVDTMYNVIRVFSPSFDRTMMDYITVFGNEVWFPHRDIFEDDAHAYQICSTLRHERAHLLDRQGLIRSLWFSLSYILFLPMFYTMRAHWEWRGYVQTMLFEYEHHGDVSEATRARIAKIMTTGGYAWMMAPWRKKEARARIDRYVEQFKDGTIKGYSLHGER